MQTWISQLTEPPPVQLSRTLTPPPNEPPRAAHRWGFWVALVLLCALPRVALAFQLRSYCNDAYFYVYIADQIAAGDFAPLLDNFGVNVYPLVLVAGQQLGLSLSDAGVVWGVLLGSFLVLPLYGWIRRLGTDQLALAACLLYAAQPRLIELSIEPIRDVTFWFFFTWCLFFFWRAMEDLKLRWFLAAGTGFALAIHVRMEGWLLLVPLLTWFFVLLKERSRDRGRVVAGGLGVLAMAPVLLILVNLTLFRDLPEWQVGKLRHLVTSWNWVRAQVLILDASPEDAPAPVVVTAESQPVSPALLRPTPTPTPAFSTVANEKPRATKAADQIPAKPVAATSPTVGESPSAVPSPAPVGARPPQILPFAQRIHKFLHHFNSSLKPLNWLLLFGGLIGGRHWLRTQRFLPLVLLAVLVSLAVWIMLSVYGTANGRYFLTAYLALLPFEALGLLGFLHWSAGVRNALSKTETAGRRWAMVWLLTLFLVGWIDAFDSRHNLRTAEGNLVAWLKTSGYSTTQVAVDHGAKRIGYHLHQRMPTVLDSPWALASVEDGAAPETVIVSRWCLPPAQYPAFLGAVESWNYRVADVPDFPESGHLWVLVRKGQRSKGYKGERG